MTGGREPVAGADGPPGRRRRGRRAVAAGAAGLVVAVVVALAVHHRPADQTALTASGPSAQESTAGTATPSPRSSGTARPDADALYGAMTPYPAPSGPVRGPAGFSPVFVEHLGRHGSRTMVSLKTSARASDLWHEAERADALTPLGARLGPALEKVDAATRRIGAGTLTTLGEREERDIGRREGERLRALFERGGSRAGRVSIVTSGRPRTVASAEHFVEGLRDAVPQVEVAEPRVDRRTLYFHDSDDRYAAFLEDGPWRARYESAVAPVRLPTVSRLLLERLYRPSFVRGLDDPVGAAEDVFEVYRSAPALADDVEVDLEPFVTGSAAAAFAFEDDARTFYAKGPGVVGDRRSFSAAQVLLDDFRAALDERLDGGSTAAVYRFTHAEELVPFVALLGLPGSEPLPAGRPYSWEGSAFRSAQVSPLAANLTWTVWRDAGGRTLIGVQVDERTVELGRGCRSESDLPGYYGLEELRRCLAEG